MNFAIKKIYLFAGAFLITIILLVSLVIFPIFEKVKNSSIQLSQKKEETDSLLQNWQSLETTKKDYAAMSQEISQLPALLAPNEAIKFILTVENFAQATQNQEDISVASQINDATASQQPEKTLDFQISLAGNFPNLIKFLIYLENAPYYNNVKSLQISRSNETGPKSTGGDINSIINLSVYQTDANPAK